MTEFENSNPNIYKLNLATIQDPLERLKLMAIKQKLTKGSNYRVYYGKKDVVEFLLDSDYYNWFWDLWRNYKEDVKSIGFRLYCDNHGFKQYILYCEILYVYEFMLELHERYSGIVKDQKGLVVLKDCIQYYKTGGK